MSVPVEDLRDPDSKVIAVPESLIAVCPRHGIIATVTLEREQSSAWELRCGTCGSICTLEKRSNLSDL